MRRTTVIAVLLLIMAVAGGLMAAVKDTPIKVVLDGKAQNLRPSAVMHDGKAYLPLSATVSAAKGVVTQDKAKKTYVVKCGSKTTTIKESDGTKINGQFFVASDLMAKAINAGVKWDKAAKTVTFTSNKEKGGGKPACPPGG